jgi:uncharacterized membrane protein SpoIIM required for sporulation
MDLAFKLKSVEFRREREASWLELESLIDRVEKKGVATLSPAELSRLPILYRAALSSLSVARAISLDQNVLDYLESLTERAYFCVYGVKRHLRDALRDFFGQRFPSVVRRLRFYIVVSALMVVLGVATGLLLTLADENRFYSFVDAELAQGRGPTASTDELREVLYHQESAGDTLANFAAFLFTHNSRVSILAFAMGFLVGLPSLYFMFTNGLMLGAFAALYHQRGLSLDFWGWILPHGVSELSAMIFCGAAGLALAHGLLFPGPLSRRESLARRGREAGQLVIGAVCMLLVAGLIEGVFRQTVMAVPVRYAVAGTTAALWIFYFTRVGRAAERVE